jgi:hypothetical protein
LYWDRRVLRQYDRMGGSRWTRVIGVLVIIALVVLVGHQVFELAWSNHCDPGNARFNLIKSERAVGFHAPGELFTWENDRPDNLWTCSNASLSLDHVGQDIQGMYRAIRANMTDTGWTELDLGQRATDFSLYQKTTSGGLRLTAVVIQQPAWVEVDIDAPGLHPGDQGF